MTIKELIIELLKSEDLDKDVYIDASTGGTCESTVSVLEYDRKSRTIQSLETLIVE